MSAKVYSQEELDALNTRTAVTDQGLYLSYFIIIKINNRS